MKVHKLEGVELDAAVLRLEDAREHRSWPMVRNHSGQLVPEFRPSQEWADGGPIIAREEISIYTQGYGEENWVAGYDFSLNEWDYGGQTGSGCSIEMNYSAFGSTPLIAAMRAYVSRADASAGKLEGVDQI